MVKRVGRGIAAAEKSEMPGFIKPQLAILKAKAPAGSQWLHEIKFDGYRVQIRLNKGKRKVYTRNGLDWTKRFSIIAGVLDIPGQAIIDGEVVVIHEGRTNFSELQAELAAGRQDRLVFYAFDLLWRDGDVRKLPQIERKQMLSDLLGENGIEHPIIYSEHLIGHLGKRACHHMKRGAPMISKTVNPMKGNGGRARKNIDAKRPIPPRKIMPHNTRNKSVCFSTFGISRYRDSPRPNHTPPKKRRLLSSTAFAGIPAEA
jgi:hypothetical protein